MSKETLFFVALLPPPSIQEHVTEIKHYVAERYDSRHALKSPPHITLQPPFKWVPERIDELQHSLSSFAQSQPPISITLDGFSAFPPRVIYIHVARTQPLLTLHQAFIEHLEVTIGLVDPKEKSRPYAPHMTVAFRDLTKQNFKLAWNDFKEKSLHFGFTASHLALLIHTGQRWEVHKEFPFSMVNR
ncbi:MAG: 2'-5' RNA ligase family protein [Myxacorys chilensis ATA2-1-KO14]|jgi:2'-5' RNA ligase|nr:2'-5' RNA ligase family protein [Myxacorys chilensis ATA2-1-KO14]